MKFETCQQQARAVLTTVKFKRPIECEMNKNKMSERDHSKYMEPPELFYETFLYFGKLDNSNYIEVFKFEMITDSINCKSTNT